MPSLRQTRPLIGRFLVPRDVLLVWEPKTPKNSLKKPFFDQKWHHQGSSTQTGSSAAHAQTSLHYLHVGRHSSHLTVWHEMNHEHRGILLNMNHAHYLTCTMITEAGSCSSHLESKMYTLVKKRAVITDTHQTMSLNIWVC